MKLKALMVGIVVSVSTYGLLSVGFANSSAENMDHSSMKHGQMNHSGMDHESMDHSSMKSEMNHHSVNSTQLTQAGNDAFGTIQEVINQLVSDPNTDWQKVDLEALRQHLIDMNEMTLNVEVVEQTQIDNGIRIQIKPTTARASDALDRILQAHPVQLNSETGWTMIVEKNKDNYILSTTSKNKQDTNKIRVLGYIGLMALGNHHQIHHWMMSTGQDPHEMHH